MEDAIKLGFTVGTFIFAYLIANVLAKRHEFSYLSKRKDRFSTIDGVRGYLAIAVFFHHFMVTWYYKNNGIWAEPPEDYFRNYGKVGVAIFFMITGFLFISKLLRNKGETDWLKLFESRIFRIFPLYIFVLLLITLIVFNASNFKLLVDPLVLVKSYISQLCFINSDINNFSQTFIIIAGVNWTLKYEWIFYLSLPLIAKAFKCGNITSTLLIVLCCMPYIFKINLSPIDSELFILFAIGGVCAQLNQTKLVNSKFFASGWASVISLSSLLIALLYPKTFSVEHILFISIFFFTVSLGNDMFGLFRKKSSMLLGELSYSIYLLHGVILYFSFTLLNVIDLNELTLNSYLLFMPLLCLLVIIFSTLTYLIIELPFIRYGRRYFISNTLRKFGLTN